MNEFVASNGKCIETLEDGQIAIVQPIPGSPMEHRTWAGPDDAQALREFFLAQRDAELGRWRSKEHPEYVVHEHGDGRVRVMRELDGSSYSFDRESVHRFYPHCDAEVDFQRIAREFFAAHPESKPWHDAKSGEVWLLTIDGADAALLVDPGQFTDGNLGWDFDDPSITAGRRIWPEVQS